MEKLFIQEEDLLLDAFRLGVKVFDSGFRPDFIVGLWRGGSSVGIIVQECLQFLGVETDHISIRTSYHGARNYEMRQNTQEIRVHGTQYLLETMNAGDGLLIVDDVYSSGQSVQAVIDKLARRTKRNMPRDVRIAVPWYRPAHRKTRPAPHYYLNETDRWLVLPYELDGLSAEEIERHKPFLKPILQAVGS